MNTQTSDPILGTQRPQNQESSNDLRAKVQDTARAMKDAAQEWQRKATEAARNAGRLTDDYVHENPWPVLVSVASACFLLGFILGRRD